MKTVTCSTLDKCRNADRRLFSASVGSPSATLSLNRFSAADVKPADDEVDDGTSLQPGNDCLVTPELAADFSF